jgi:Phosphoesterase family
MVSPYSKGGHVVHSYADHVSILKFIERNWHLEPLSGRSRDNLPNPICRRRRSLCAGERPGNQRFVRNVRLPARSQPPQSRLIVEPCVMPELSVPRQIGNGFEALSETGPIGYRRRGVIRAVAGFAEYPD